MTPLDVATTRLVAEGLDHPECVVVAPGGVLYAGGESGQIYRIDAASGQVSELASTGGWILGLALLGDGALLACDAARREVVHVSTHGEITVISSGTQDLPFTTPNYISFDDDGNAYVSDSGDWLESNGRIYRITPDGVTTVWATSSSEFPNGLALDASGRYLYVAESTLPGVTRFPVQDDGSAGAREVVAELPETVPDGLAFDVNGGLVIGCYRPDQILYLDPNGRDVTVLAEDPQGTAVGAPTNVAFGGLDGRDVYFANFGRWHVSVLRAATPGLPVRVPPPGVPAHPTIGDAR